MISLKYFYNVIPFLPFGKSAIFFTLERVQGCSLESLSYVKNLTDKYLKSNIKIEYHPLTGPKIYIVSKTCRILKCFSIVLLPETFEVNLCYIKWWDAHLHPKKKAESSRGIITYLITCPCCSQAHIGELPPHKTSSFPNPEEHRDTIAGRDRIADSQGMNVLSEPLAGLSQQNLDMKPIGMNHQNQLSRAPWHLLE